MWNIKGKFNTRQRKYKLGEWININKNIKTRNERIKLLKRLTNYVL